MRQEQTILSILQKNGSFLSKVFIHLICQLIITAIVAYLMRGKEITGLEFGLIFISQIILMILILFIKPVHIIYKIILFVIFSVSFGIILSPLNNVNKDILLSSLVGTISVFVVFFMLGLIVTSYGYDLSWLSAFLLVSLLLLIFAGFISYFCNISSTAHKIYLYFGLIIFSLYVLMDTNNILTKDIFNKDFVSSTMGYYLDILNLFMKFVQLQR